jgi:hypothetical protein
MIDLLSSPRAEIGITLLIALGFAPNQKFDQCGLSGKGFDALLKQ